MDIIYNCPTCGFPVPEKGKECSECVAVRKDSKKPLGRYDVKMMVLEIRKRRTEAAAKAEAERAQQDAKISPPTPVDWIEGVRQIELGDSP